MLDLFNSVNITEDGKQALLTLSNGDMRRALNILQVCAIVIRGIMLPFL